ncbi:MAG: phage tail terminator protein [Panacagrimonas sp.]
MRLDPVIARLKAALPWARRIEGAVDLSRASEMQQFSADLYVVDFGERASPNQRINAHRQKVEATLAVVQWSVHAGDATGGKARVQMEDRRHEIIAALCNWQPTSDDDPFAYVGGELVSFAPPGILWSDRFTTSYQLVIPNGC